MRRIKVVFIENCKMIRQRKNPMSKWIMKVPKYSSLPYKDSKKYFTTHAIKLLKPVQMFWKCGSFITFRNVWDIWEFYDLGHIGKHWSLVCAACTAIINFIVLGLLASLTIIVARKQTSNYMYDGMFSRQEIKMGLHSKFPWSPGEKKLFHPKFCGSFIPFKVLQCGSQKILRFSLLFI